jgi:hypothetical protein
MKGLSQVKYLSILNTNLAGVNNPNYTCNGSILFTTRIRDKKNHLVSHRIIDISYLLSCNYLGKQDYLGKQFNFKQQTEKLHNFTAIILQQASLSSTSSPQNYKLRLPQSSEHQPKKARTIGQKKEHARRHHSSTENLCHSSC